MRHASEAANEWTESTQNSKEKPQVSSKSFIPAKQTIIP